MPPGMGGQGNMGGMNGMGGFGGGYGMPPPGMNMGMNMGMGMPPGMGMGMPPGMGGQGEPCCLAGITGVWNLLEVDLVGRFALALPVPKCRA